MVSRIEQLGLRWRSGPSFLGAHTCFRTRFGASTATTIAKVGLHVAVGTLRRMGPGSWCAKSGNNMASGIEWADRRIATGPWNWTALELWQTRSGE